MYNPQIKEVISMCKTLTDKHIGEMNYLTLDWQVVQTFDARYPDKMIEQLLPLLVIDFK